MDTCSVWTCSGCDRLSCNPTFSRWTTYLFFFSYYTTRILAVFCLIFIFFVTWLLTKIDAYNLLFTHYRGRGSATSSKLIGIVGIHSLKFLWYLVGNSHLGMHNSNIVQLFMCHGNENSVIVIIVCGQQQDSFTTCMCEFEE